MEGFPGDQRMFNAVTGPGCCIDQLLGQEFDVWAFDEARWICVPARTGVVRGVEHERGVYDVVMNDLPGQSTECFSSPFSCTMGQRLLCPDMKFRTLEEIAEKRLPVQHPRGNGHVTSVKSIKERDFSCGVFVFAVPKWMTVIHGAVVFSAAGVPA